MTKNKSVSSLFAKYTLSIVEKASRSVRLFLWNRAFPSLKANYIGQGCRLSISMGASVSSKGGLAFSNCGSIVAKRGILALGKNAFIGVGVQIVCRQSIKIGDDCLFAEYVTIRDHDHVFDSHLPTALAGFVSEPIVIGNNVWLGAKVTVLKGVSIGDNVVIGANSVVTRDVPANSVAVGIPARVIRTLGVAE